MANEVKVTFQLNSSHGNYKQSITPGTMTFSLTTQGGAEGVQSIGTSEENLDYGDVAAADVGYLYMRNLDSTNYVTWGMSDAGTMKAVGKMKAGEFVFLRVVPSVNVRLLANTAACKVEYRLLQD